ncbi:MAG TPA: hypothetical protein VLO30_09060 [Chthoniobacterales bacterium]|nr:hypothetical protein [Chthoniobacterales bacterium]
MIRLILQRYGLLLGLLLLSLFKLWVLHTEETYGSSAEFDALWYVGSANHWYWGATYSWTGFVRPCAYPLFIAVVHFCGIPLRIAIELVQMAGYTVFIAALRKAGVLRPICVGIFALMILHPAALLYNNHSMSDSFYAAILPLALGGSLLTLFTKKFSNALWTGVAYAVLWNTREESFLIPLILLVFFILALWQSRVAPTRKAHFVFWAWRAGALVATLAVVVAAVYSANYRAFGSFAKSDLSSPAFEKTFKALLRIKPSYSLRYIAVNVEALHLAYEVSPTFARLKPEFEGLNGRNWTNPVFDRLGVREYGPWFMWALRNVTANTGYYKDPVSTNAFYRKAAREINQACDEGRIPTRLVVSSFLDPGALSRIRYLPRSIGKIAKLFLFRHQKVMVRADTTLVPWMSQLYQEMVFRQPQVRIDESNAVMIPNTISARLAVAVQNFIGAYYVYLFIGLGWAGLAAFLLLIWFHRRWRGSDPLIATLLLLGAAIITRVVFFSFLDATWWMGGYERYVFPVMPLSTCFFILLINEAWIVCRRPPSTVAAQPFEPPI